MIKFFRHIRRQLLGEGKTGKYLKYAIGEILLVMVGILLALQINNWKQDIDRKQLETVLIKQLKEEMLRIYRDIYSDYNLIELGTRSHFRILDYIENDVAYSDSMCFDFSFIKIDEYIYPKDAVYSRIKDEGLDIIRNDTIRYLIQNIYESIFPRLSKMNSFNPDISEVFDDYYLEHFKLNTDYSIKFSHVADNDTLSGEIYTNQFHFPFEIEPFGVKRDHTYGFVPLDFEALKRDHKFRMLLDKTNGYRVYKLIRYSSAKDNIQELIALIDKELNLKQD